MLIVGVAGLLLTVTSVGSDNEVHPFVLVARTVYVVEPTGSVVGVVMDDVVALLFAGSFPDGLTIHVGVDPVLFQNPDMRVGTRNVGPMVPPSVAAFVVLAALPG